MQPPDRPVPDDPAGRVVEEMAHKNKVLKSFNWGDEGRCVDIFVRPDSSFGFEEYRRDLEDGRGWFPIGFHSERVFGDPEDAFDAALESVSWLHDVSPAFGV